MKLQVTVVMFLGLLALWAGCEKTPGDSVLPEKGADEVFIAGPYTYSKTDYVTPNGCTLHVRTGKLVISQRGTQIWGTMEDEVIDGFEIPQSRRQVQSFTGEAKLDKVVIDTSDTLLEAALKGYAPPFSLYGKYYSSDFSACSWEGEWEAVRRPAEEN